MRSPGSCRMISSPWERMSLFYIIGAALCAWGAVAEQEVVKFQGTELVILPRSPVQVKPEGRSALLTCRPEGRDVQHVSRMRWEGPDRRPVEQVSANPTRPKPPVYAERLSSDGSLSLIIQKLRRQDEGNYACLAIYGGGEVLARSVEIRVIKAISWVEAQQEQFARLGSPFKLMCKVEAEPPATVDWQKDGKPLPERYRQETDGLSIESAEPEDEGVYTCRAIVVATGELQTRPIKLQVQVPPTFAEERREVITRANRDETVECHADGRPPSEFSWIYEPTGRDLSIEGGRFRVNSLTGALHISPVRPEDDGLYSCVAHNAAGEARQPVQVHVHVPPRVTVVRNATREVGLAAELVCHAHGRPLPSVSWRRHGEQNLLAPGQQGSDPRVATGSKPAGKEHPDRSDGTLSWDAVNRSDDGLYACVGKNDAGVAEDFGHLTVEFKPSFANTPYSDFWSWDGQIANITCLAESIPNATIRWFYNNRDLEKTPIPQLKKLGEGPQSWLVVDPAFQQRYAAYKCEAKNRHGTEIHEIVLHKAEKPGPIMQAVFHVVTATTIKFKIVGPNNDGGIQTKIYNVRYRKVDQIGNPWSSHAWTAESDYTLEGLEPQTRYEFQFSAQNDVGEGPWGATQSTVMPKRSPPESPPLMDRPSMAQHPDAPVETPVVSAYPTHFELRWNIPADNGEPILNYLISWCPARRSKDARWEQDRSGTCRDVTVPATSHTTSYRLQPLQPGTQYMVHIKATNYFGPSKPSELLLKTIPDHTKGPYDESMSTSGSSPCCLFLAASVPLPLLGLLLLLLLPALPTAPH